MWFKIDTWPLNLHPLCSGADRLPPPLLWAPAQPGGVHLPLRYRHVRPPVLHWEPAGQWWRKSRPDWLERHLKTYSVFTCLCFSPSSLRNWSSRKLPSSTSCRTSSTTAIKWYEWLPSRWENTFILIPRWLCWDSWGGNLWLVPPGVRPAGLHRVRAEQCSASTAEGQHVHSRVPVHAAHLAPKQVMCMQDSHDALVLRILAVVVPAPSHPTPDGTVDRIESISFF